MDLRLYLDSCARVCRGGYRGRERMARGRDGGIAHRRMERARCSWVLSQGSDAYLILVIVGDGALVDRTGGIGGLVSSDRSRKAEILASRDEGREVRVISRGSYRLDRGSRRLGVAISLRVAAVFDAPERLRIVAGGEGGVPVSVEGLKGKKAFASRTRRGESAGDGSWISGRVGSHLRGSLHAEHALGGHHEE